MAIRAKTSYFLIVLTLFEDAFQGHVKPPVSLGEECERSLTTVQNLKAMLSSFTQ